MATVILLQDILPRAASWTAQAGRGGHTVFVLQWLRGLQALGHRVLFVNHVEGDAERLAGARQRFAQVVDAWWHASRAALIAADPWRSLWGASVESVAAVAREADALITLSISGRPEPPAILADVRPRILVDTDPGYTQLWSQVTGAPEKVFGLHDVYFTVGGNIGTSRCALPTFGVRWIPTRPPVLLDLWKPETPIARDHFTTVADWWGEGYLEFEGRVLGPKREEFLRFLDLPARCGEAIHPVLDIPPGDPDLELLEDHGWKVESPARVVSPEGYVDWVAGSCGEFSCAKGVYVGTRCGWFSDRSACYLAAGRPVVAQETGFSDVLPAGEGLFAVRTLDEAAVAVRAIRRDYRRHARAARQLAVEHFDSARVLTQLLVEAGIGG
jgi:hypothetical protein